jgi:hypothetical protein
MGISSEHTRNPFILRAARTWCAISVALAAVLAILFLLDSVTGHLLKRGQDEWIGRIADTPYYDGKPWKDQFVSDSLGNPPARVDFAPFVGWRRPELSSGTTNIDPRGVRVTPGANCSGSSFKVHFYGGSTVWGSGSPDFATIPAFFEKKLANRLRKGLCVVNYGESAWVSGQATIQFMLNLRDHNVPDIALFYGGWNDRWSAYDNGSARAHLLARRMRRAFVNSFSAGGLFAGLFPTLSSVLFPPANALDQERTLPAGLKEDVLSVFKGNMEVAQALGRQYGVKVQFFWEPDLFVESRKLTAQEEAVRKSFAPGFVRFMKSIKFTSDDPSFHDLSEVLSSVPDRVFLDHVHVTPQANELIADRILKILEANGTLVPTLLYL